MELYILSKQDLSILSIPNLTDYEINLDEETNAKSTFQVMKCDGLKKDNFIVVNGLYKQFLFVIDDVQTEKGSNTVNISALDISNIFDRKVIEKNTNTMTSASIEQFIANTIYSNFVNSEDTVLNISYIDIYYNTNTQAVVATNAENGLYNFHTFLTNCRQHKNIYTEFKIENGKLRIDVENKTEITVLIDTTLPEVTDYNKIYETDVTAKVTVLIREDNSEYNLYLKTDRTTTTNKDGPDRASGKIEVISVDTADKAPTEALNVMKGNNYKHLVEFKIAKTSKLMDIKQFTIGRPILIKTEDSTYESYISAITIRDENFIYFKTGSIRATLLDKLKTNSQTGGNKLDVSGGKIVGNLNVTNSLQKNGNEVVCDIKYYTGSCNNINETCMSWLEGGTEYPPEAKNPYGFLSTQIITENYVTQEFKDANSNRMFTRNKISGEWTNWESIAMVKPLKILSSPLTKENTVLYDYNISLTKLVIAYCTCQYRGSNYRDSIIIPTEDTEWSIVNGYEGKTGYIRVNKAKAEIIVSEYSDAEFAVLGYTLIN